MVSISPHDRMHFALFIAAVIHASLIFGIGFSGARPGAKSPALEVTLAMHRRDNAPDNADFLAQANQAGSGVLEEKALLSTTEVTDFYDNKINTIQTERPKLVKQTQDVNPNRVTTTGRSSQKLLAVNEDIEMPEYESASEASEALLKESNEIASLAAQIREKNEAYAKRPRKKTLTALSTRASVDAAYLDGWRRKVENVGNSRYGELDVGSRTGSLRMLVAVKADGTISKVQLLESSGHPELDAAALRVVRLAAPFEPFPKEVRANADILEIIRTWRFEKGSYLSSTTN